MNRLSRSLAFLLVLALPALPALATAGLPVIAKGPKSLLHKPAPQFVRPDLRHQTVDLSSYRGRVVLLNFWATWCAPCQLEIPRFVQWQNDLGPQGLQVIGISMDDDSTPVLSLTRRLKVNYPVLMGDAHLGASYGGVLGLPVTFLIDRQGNIAAVYQGQTSLPALHREIRRLLAEKASTP